MGADGGANRSRPLDAAYCPSSAAGPRLLVPRGRLRPPRLPYESTLHAKRASHQPVAVVRRWPRQTFAGLNDEVYLQSYRRANRRDVRHRLVPARSDTMWARRGVGITHLAPLSALRQWRGCIPRGNLRYDDATIPGSRTALRRFCGVWHGVGIVLSDRSRLREPCRTLRNRQSTVQPRRMAA